MDAHDDGVAIGVVGNVLVVVWRRVPSAARVRLLIGATARMMASRPNGFCYLGIIEPTSTPPKAPERLAMTRALEQTNRLAGGFAFVIEGDDARTWIVRTILRGIAILVRSGLTKTFVSTVPEGIVWLSARMDLGTSLETIEEEVARLRSLMPPAEHARDRLQQTL